MYEKKEPSQRILQRARSQAGVLTSGQLDELKAPTGARRRWIAGWTRMGHGYYCIHEPTFESWCFAGKLRAGPTGAITGRAAGHLHGFVRDEPGLITIYHQRCEPLSPMGDDNFSVRFRRGSRAGRGTPARTPAEVALLDLARESDRNQTIDAIARAVAESMTTPERVLSHLDQVKRVRHMSLMREVCEQAGQGVQSVLEWLFHNDVIRRHGLPEGQLQVTLISGTRSDVHFADHGFVVELDGRLGHEEEPFRDMDRDNRLAIRGILTLRFGWHDILTRPCAVALQIRELLARRGGLQGGHRCGRCRQLAG
ncbi:hypothetical protein GCM10028820_17100 [Tessaracoccus terricola]